jgi:acyl-CoA reductase-like NAD-dependent aldehyde dehydrogenase
MPSEFSDIRAAATDGRAHNHFFRHEELKRLHAALSENASEIQDSMVRGGGYRSAEAKAEFWLAMRCLRGVFSNLEPKKSIQSEYAISYLKDAPEARQPIGVIVVKPPKQPFFYSLISALAPAIAEGNCVVVQVRNAPSSKVKSTSNSDIA